MLAFDSDLRGDKRNFHYKRDAQNFWDLMLYEPKTSAMTGRYGLEARLKQWKISGFSTETEIANITT